jgi:hypothetical protein
MNGNYKLSGRLTTDDTSGDYILQKKHTEFNLSSLLDKIYYSEDSNHIEITITDGKKILFQEDGLLNYGKVAPKTYKYFINGNNLQKVLDDSFYKDLDITIVSEALDVPGGIQYEQSMAT